MSGRRKPANRPSARQSRPSPNRARRHRAAAVPTSSQRDRRSIHVDSGRSLVVPDTVRFDRLGLLAVAALCIFVFLELRPGLIFANTRPATGDLAAHLFGPTFMAHHLWDSGLLSGWSSAWFGGFPAFLFYPPLPALAAVLAGIVLPSGVALKVVVAVSLVALPAAAAFVARAADLPYPGTMLMASAAVVSLFESSQHSLGGNIASAATGEYAYAFSLVLCLIAMAVFARDLQRGRSGPAAALIGAAAAVSHPVGAMFLVVNLVCQVAFVPAPTRRSAVIHILRTLGLMGLLAAFWYLPFWTYRVYTNELAFHRRTSYGGLLFPYSPFLELAFVGLAVFGAYDAVRHRRAAILSLSMTAMVCALGVLVLPRGFLFNGRVAPLWNLCRLLVAAAGATAVVRSLARRHAVLVLTSILGSALVALGIAWNNGTLPLGHAKTTSQGQVTLLTDYQWLVGPSHPVSVFDQIHLASFAGAERGPQWSEYVGIVNRMQTIARDRGCGRVATEFDPTGQFGSLYALTLLPLDTNGCLTTINGLLRDSSPTSNLQMVAESAWSSAPEHYKPGLHYEPPNLARSVAYFRELGVKYFLAFSPPIADEASATPGLTKLDKVGFWTIFAVDDEAIVEPLTQAPLVFPGLGSSRQRWEGAALAWFQQADPGALRFAADGPPGWPRAHTTPPNSPAPPASEIQVSDVVEKDGHVSFTVDHPGTPMLVRVSYFPTWHAIGADGPWRVAPNWMVVVPRSTKVRLVNETSPVEWLASILTIVGLVLSAIVAALAHRSKFGSLQIPPNP